MVLYIFFAFILVISFTFHPNELCKHSVHGLSLMTPVTMTTARNGVLPGATVTHLSLFLNGVSLPTNVIGNRV